MQQVQAQRFGREGLVAVADDGGDTGDAGEFFRSALGIAAGDDDARVRVEAMRAADVGAGFAVGFGGDAAGVDDDHIGVGPAGIRTSPAARRRAAIASPSARAARQPKFSMWKVGGTGLV